MKIILFSTIHIRDQAHADAIKPDLIDWYNRMILAFDYPLDIFLCESGSVSYSTLQTVCAGIQHDRPYHCKDWSYFVANLYYALFHVLHKYSDFDLCVAVQSDTILGTHLQEVADEFMTRPEILAAPGWTSGSPDTHCLIMKRQAMMDILYSLPFTPFPKVDNGNSLYIEHALGELFRDRWWNPWPAAATIRQEYSTPEVFKGTDDEIMSWPLLAKASPAIAKRYRSEHPSESKAS